MGAPSPEVKTLGRAVWETGLVGGQAAFQGWVLVCWGEPAASLFAGMIDVFVRVIVKDFTGWIDLKRQVLLDCD